MRAVTRAAHRNAELRHERDERVEANLPPEHVFLWRALRRGIRGATAHERFERMEQYAHDHPVEVLASLVLHGDREVRRLVRERRRQDEIDRPWRPSPRRKRSTAPGVPLASGIGTRLPPGPLPPATHYCYAASCRTCEAVRLIGTVLARDTGPTDDDGPTGYVSPSAWMGMGDHTPRGPQPYTRPIPHGARRLTPGDVAEVLVTLHTAVETDPRLRRALRRDEDYRQRVFAEVCERRGLGTDKLPIPILTLRAVETLRKRETRKRNDIIFIRGTVPYAYESNDVAWVDRSQLREPGALRFLEQGRMKSHEASDRF